MSYNFRFSALAPYTGEIVTGVLLTLQLSLVTMLMGLVIGLFVALGSTSPLQSIRIPVRVYVEAIRNTPLLVQLFIVFFGLPSPASGLTPMSRQSSACRSTSVPIAARSCAPASSPSARARSKPGGRSG